MKRIVLALGLLVCVACDGTRFVGFEDTSGVVTSIFAVTIADTAAERAAGLRDRPALQDNEALWLRFPVTDEICIVNSGVPYDIDVLFVDEDDAVIAIERGVPAEDATARCVMDTRSVVEVVAGAAADVQVGFLLKTSK